MGGGQILSAPPLDLPLRPTSYTGLIVLPSRGLQQNQFLKEFTVLFAVILSWNYAAECFFHHRCYFIKIDTDSVWRSDNEIILVKRTHAIWTWFRSHTVYGNYSNVTYSSVWRINLRCHGAPLQENAEIRVSYSRPTLLSKKTLKYVSHTLLR